LEARFGTQIKSDVFQQLLDSSLQAALIQKELNPVSQPKVEPGALNQGTEFNFTAEVEIQPEIELSDYEGLDVEAVDIKVEDNDIEEELKRVAQQAAQVVPVTDRDVAQSGDMVQLDYEGSVDGVPFEGGKAENAMLEVGGDGYIPGFAEGLDGATVPGEISVDVTFPEDYHASDLAGKLATFKMTLKELKVRETPAIDDDLAQDMGEENLEAYKAKISEGIEHRRKHEAEDQEKKNLLEALVKANPFDVAPSMVEEQLDRMVEGAARQLQMYTGQNMDFSAEEMEQLRQDQREQAEFQVRSGLLLLEVAKKAEVQVGFDEVKAEIDKMAAQAGDNSDRVRAYYGNPQEMMRLQYRLTEDRTVIFLREKSSLGPKHECDGGEEA
jgi:trigger factor